MKKLILLVVLGIFTITVYQSCTQEEVYMDEQIEVNNDLQKDGGDDIVPFDDDTSGGTSYCSAYNYSTGQRHNVRKYSAFSYKCTISGSLGTHKTMSNATSATYHCKTFH